VRETKRDGQRAMERDAAYLADPEVQGNQPGLKEENIRA
jgi:hypothetical protein